MYVLCIHRKSALTQACSIPLRKLAVVFRMSIAGWRIHERWKKDRRVFAERNLSRSCGCGQGIRGSLVESKLGLL